MFSNLAITFALKKAYPYGTRVKLIRSNHKLAPKAGTEGSVTTVYGPDVYIVWDDGKQTAMSLTEDVIVKIR